MEIAKAVGLDARILVMDEPPAALTAQEAEALFGIIRDCRGYVLRIVYVSHWVDEVFRLADRVTVFRDGRHVAAQPIGEIGRTAVIEMMVSRQLDQEFPKVSAPLGEERLAVRDLRRGTAVNGVSFASRWGEVLGLTGLIGAERTEVARLIFGADKADAGSVAVDGLDVSIRSPRNAIRHRIALVTEDRKGQGLALQHSVRDSSGLPNLRRFARCGVIDGHREAASFAGYVR